MFIRTLNTYLTYGFSNHLLIFLWTVFFIIPLNADSNVMNVASMRAVQIPPKIFPVFIMIEPYHYYLFDTKYQQFREN